MLKPKKEVCLLTHQDIKRVDRLNILCWNVAKLTEKDEFKSFFEKLVESESLNYFILQEVKSNINFTLTPFINYSYVFSPNMETKRNIYGVMNIFPLSCFDVQTLLSQKKELKLATHKAVLITKHELNDKIVTIVNIHALNFVSSRDFEYELNLLKARLIEYKGYLIVAGDFNTWNKNRVVFLENFCKELDLKRVVCKNEEQIKKVFKNSLDHIFYRGIILEEAKVIKCSLSDHNPIIASFTI